MKEIYLIRHGKTYGNTLGRYIGTTDEPLCEKGREELKAFSYPKPDQLFASPLKRCMETASILFPGQEIHPAPALRECAFGDFENKNYQELSVNPAYQAWIDSDGTLPFPGGERREEFERRCREGFLEIFESLQASPAKRIAFVVHGGTIMSILSAYAEQKQDFYHWQVKNGEGFRMLAEEREEGGVRFYEISHLCADPGRCARSDLR